MAKAAGITLYETLGLEPGASQEDIRKAYRRLLRTAHPDSGGTVGMFRAIQHAYDVLSDPKQRADYDAGGTPTGEGTASPPGSEGAQSEAPPRSKPAQEEPRPPTPMEDIPPLPNPGFPEPHFLPPEHPPEVSGKTPRWTKVWALVLAALGLILTLFQLLGMWATASFRQDIGGDSGAAVAEFVPRIVGTVIFFLIVASLPYVILKLKGRKPVRVPLATDFLRPQHLRVREFGVPGEGLSAARFGNRAKLGKIGEERTAQVLRKAALELCPSARVIHGLSWPGTDHADIDHVLIIGNVLMLVDSKYMKDGEYWFDNEELYRDGVKLEPFKLGYALAEMRRRFPGLAMSGVVVMHSATGKLQRPPVEMANTPQRRRSDDKYAPVAVMNPFEFINLLQAHVRNSNDDAVHTPLLRDLLSLSK